LDARKALGQNFLLDPGIVARIAAQAGDLCGRDVVEIGPGPGGLTRALLRSRARRVIAVEKDERCVLALGQLEASYPERLRVVAGDALTLPPQDLADRPCWIVANLPYNVATPLLVKWLQVLAEDATAFEGLILMFQKEVAQRLTAAPGSVAYGRLSVLTQWLCTAGICFDLPPGAFRPPPKVTSSVVRLIPRSAPLAPAERGKLEAVTAAAFGQRRKMLRQSLKPLWSDPRPVLAAAGIAETARAETLSVADYCRLAERL